MELSKNVDFLQKIDSTVKAIMKDGKIDQFDIPEIMLLITELITTSEESKITTEQLEQSINTMYEYIMTHYKLFPSDEEQRNSFNKLFKMCVKLILFTPKVKNALKKSFKCIG